LRDTAETRTKSKAKSKTARAQKKASTEAEPTNLTPEQIKLKARLREWRKAEAAKTGKPAFIVFGDSILHNLVVAAPKTISELLEVSGIGPEKADRYGADIIAIFRRTSSTPPAPAEKKPAPQPKRSEPPPSAHIPQRAAAKPVTTTESLTPNQQALDARLRDWRKATAEEIGMPQFFVLSATTLRAIVLAQPRTLDHLRAVDGIGHEKLERYGPGILAICNT